MKANVSRSLDESFTLQLNARVNVSFSRDSVLLSLSCLPCETSLKLEAFNKRPPCIPNSEMELTVMVSSSLLLLLGMLYFLVHILCYVLSSRLLPTPAPQLSLCGVSGSVAADSEFFWECSHAS